MQRRDFIGSLGVLGTAGPAFAAPGAIQQID